VDSVGINELRRNARAVLLRVAAGESLLLTNRGRPVAQLSPVMSLGMAEPRTAVLGREPLGRMGEAAPAIAVAENQTTAADALATARAYER
jgi:prevent-host-death family protein